MGGLSFWPRAFTFTNYEVIFSDERFFRAMGITIARTVSGTFLSVLVTALMAFALAKKELKGKRFFMIIGIITMYFQGGLIPSYLWLRELGLFDNFWVLIIPGMLSIWNMIVFRTFSRACRRSWRNRQSWTAAIITVCSSGLCCRFPVRSLPLCHCSPLWVYGMNGSTQGSISTTLICFPCRII